MKKTNSFLIVAIAAAMSIFGTPVHAAGPKGDSVIDVARAANSTPCAEDFEGVCAFEQFDTLIFALEATGLDMVLDSRNGQVTIFAPIDDAFDALPEGLLGALVADPDLLTEVLLYHVAKGRRDAASVIDSDTIRMFNRARIGVDFDGADVYLIDNDSLGTGSADAKVIVPNIDAANGIIHVIDNVLVP